MCKKKDSVTTIPKPAKKDNKKRPKNFFLSLKSRGAKPFSRNELVRSVGFEPTRDFSHCPLKAACLPFHHDRVSLGNWCGREDLNLHGVALYENNKQCDYLNIPQMQAVLLHVLAVYCSETILTIDCYFYL